MSDALLIVNDAELTIADESSVLARSPGYATVYDGELLLGDAAYAKARLNPTQSHSQFWQQLSPEALPDGSSTVARHADLVYAHLMALWQAASEQQSLSRIALVVAGDVSKAQLGLLLGICKQVGIPIRALVSDALLAAQQPAEGQLAYLDLHLHRSVYTPLEQSSELTATKTSSDKRLGLARFQEAFANAVADCFVRNTRFDPMHSALTEQAVYNELENNLEPLRTDVSAALNITHGEVAYAAELRRDHLFASAGDLYDRLIKQIESSRNPGQPLTVLTSQRIAGLPGLGDLIQAMDDVDIQQTDARTMAEVAASMNVMNSTEGTLRMIARRPWETITREQPRVAPATSTQRPTHLLMNAKATAISSEPLLVGTSVGENQRGLAISSRYPGVSREHFSLRQIGKQVFIEDLSTYGTFVNGAKIQGRTEVFIGDHIRIGNPGAELMLIAVEQT